MDVGDGSTTAFWLDTWLGAHNLAFCFPALFSHYHRPLASVQATLSTGIENLFQRRLSDQAAWELSTHTTSLVTIHLTNSLGLRRLKFPSLPLFSSRGAYRALRIDDEELLGPKLMWESRLHGKVKFFMWLMHFDRVNPWANLYGKTSIR
jgi:hypothetical protein